MKKEEIYMKIFNFSRPTFYKWQREENQALKLIQKYFNEEDLIEFLETNKISKMEKTSKNEIEMELYFADNGLYKILNEADEILACYEFYCEDVLELMPEEIEDIMYKININEDIIIPLIEKSKNIDDFKKELEKYQLEFLSIIMNPLEIDGIIKNKEYSIAKIRKLFIKKHNKRLQDDPIYAEEIEAKEYEYDDEDYDLEEKRRKDIYGDDIP